MSLYLLIIGTVCILGAVWLLISRLLHILNSQQIAGTVVDKVTRNPSAETPMGRVKVLKIAYQNPYSGTSEYICDTSVITPLYKINDPVTLAVSPRRVLLRHWLYVLLAPSAIAIIGVMTLYISYQV